MENIYVIQNEDEIVSPVSYSNIKMMFAGVLKEFPKKERRNLKLGLFPPTPESILTKYNDRIFRYEILLDVCNAFKEANEQIIFFVNGTYKEGKKEITKSVKISKLFIVSKIK